MPTLLHLAYDGTGLSGCPEARGRRTVVGEVRAALTKLGVAADVECLSRTDAGVHATGQVAVATLVPSRSADRLLLGLDRHLPPDVRCVGVAHVETTPVVVDKTYRYELDLSAFGDPLRARTSWRVRLDPTRLVALADGLVGEVDLAAFRRRGETRSSLVRVIHEASWGVDGDVATFRVRGDGFAYRAVRSLVGAMVTVARGAGTADDWARALAGAPLDVARQVAPARGLVLEAITLDPPPPWTRTVTASSASASGSSRR